MAGSAAGRGEVSDPRRPLAYALSLHFMYYNFIRFHQSLRMPPALKAGIIDRAMSNDDIVHMLPLPVAKKRGPYKKRAKAS